MRKTFFNPRRALICVVLLLLGTSLLPSPWADVISSRPRHLVMAAIAPADHLLKPIADWMRRPANLQVDLGNQEEYERAKQLIVELQYRLSQANQTVAQLSQIRRELTLVGIGLMPATVIAWNGDRLHTTITLNQGSQHGLMIGQAVVRGFNLVGRIVNIGPVTSTVELITSPGSHLIVLIKPSSSGAEPREMIAQLSTAPGSDTFWAHTDADDPIRVGDLAHTYDDAWPSEARGFVVGKVTQIEKHPDDPILRRRAIITPIRSLAHLNRVIVIVPMTELEIGGSQQ